MHRDYENEPREVSLPFNKYQELHSHGFFSPFYVIRHDLEEVEMDTGTEIFEARSEQLR